MGLNHSRQPNRPTPPAEWIVLGVLIGPQVMLVTQTSAEGPLLVVLIRRDRHVNSADSDAVYLIGDVNYASFKGTLISLSESAC